MGRGQPVPLRGQGEREGWEAWGRETKGRHFPIYYPKRMKQRSFPGTGSVGYNFVFLIHIFLCTLSLRNVPIFIQVVKIQG